eukprot:COSAG01_NODE_5125_length_4470_cov_2.390300_4_plen_89_part_00
MLCTGERPLHGPGPQMRMLRAAVMMESSRGWLCRLACVYVRGGGGTGTNAAACEEEALRIASVMWGSRADFQFAVESGTPDSIAVCRF